MTIYLPIAEMAVNWLVIVGLGAAVGFLSGMFGVGGGFLTTPLLIFYGIPPAIAVASSATQITGASVSGAIAYWQRGGVDVKMGAVLTAGGIVGAGLGAAVLTLLKALGQIDVVINVTYVMLLGTVGGLMLREAIGAVRKAATGTAVRGRLHPHHPWIAALPWKMRFYKSGLYISPLAPFGLGIFVGILTVSLGIGGGFILVPAMIFLLGMSTSMVIGTSLFNIIFVTAAATLLNSVEAETVDIVLAMLLLVGGVVGAQLGVRAAQKLPPERLRLFLALIVVAVAIRLAIGLTWRPAELFTVYGST